MRRLITVLCLVPVAIAAGCTTTTVEGTPYEAALRQAQTCDDVLGAVQEDAIAKVDLEVQSFIDQDYYSWGQPVAFDVGRDAGAFGGAGGVPTGAPEADGDNSSEPPSGFSDTNRQVADVDEADIVKVGDEGRKLFVIRGNGFHEFDSWPAANTSKVADLEIEGGAIEMFVDKHAFLIEFFVVLIVNFLSII